MIFVSYPAEAEVLGGDGERHGGEEREQPRAQEHLLQLRGREPRAPPHPRGRRRPRAPLVVRRAPRRGRRLDGCHQQPGLQEISCRRAAAAALGRRHGNERTGNGSTKLAGAGRKERSRIDLSAAEMSQALSAGSSTPTRHVYIDAFRGGNFCSFTIFFFFSLFIISIDETVRRLSKHAVISVGK